MNIVILPDFDEMHVRIYVFTAYFFPFVLILPAVLYNNHLVEPQVLFLFVMHTMVEKKMAKHCSKGIILTAFNKYK